MVELVDQAEIYRPPAEVLRLAVMVVEVVVAAEAIYLRVDFAAGV
jgi:hypothetical protein